MKVYYRVCDVNSTNPSPLFGDDRPRLNKICLRTFKVFYPNADVTFICDYCIPETVRFIKKEYPNSEVLETSLGINESCLHQYKLYEQTNHDVVLFQECDYFHIGALTEKMINELEYVSPYDHPDKYPNEISQIKIVDNHHFKHTISTTSTFATNRAGFERNKHLFYKHGYIDHARWVELGGLWSPIPTLATHMVTNCLSPAIKWKNHFTAL